MLVIYVGFVKILSFEDLNRKLVVMMLNETAVRGQKRMEELDVWSDF